MKRSQRDHDGKIWEDPAQLKIPDLKRLLTLGGVVFDPTSNRRKLFRQYVELAQDRSPDSVESWTGHQPLSDPLPDADTLLVPQLKIFLALHAVDFPPQARRGHLVQLYQTIEGVNQGLPARKVRAKSNQNQKKRKLNGEQRKDRRSPRLRISHQHDQLSHLVVPQSPRSTQHTSTNPPVFEVQEVLHSQEPTREPSTKGGKLVSRQPAVGKRGRFSPYTRQSLRRNETVDLHGQASSKVGRSMRLRRSTRLNPTSPPPPLTGFTHARALGKGKRRAGSQPSDQDKEPSQGISKPSCNGTQTHNSPGSTDFEPEEVLRAEESRPEINVPSSDQKPPTSSASPAVSSQNWVLANNSSPQDQSEFNDDQGLHSQELYTCSEPSERGPALNPPVSSVASCSQIFDYANRSSPDAQSVFDIQEVDHFEDATLYPTDQPSHLIVPQSPRSTDPQDRSECNNDQGLHSQEPYTCSEPSERGPVHDPLVSSVASCSPIFDHANRSSPDAQSNFAIEEADHCADATLHPTDQPSHLVVPQSPRSTQHAQTSQPLCKGKGRACSKPSNGVQADDSDNCGEPSDRGKVRRHPVLRRQRGNFSPYPRRSPRLNATHGEEPVSSSVIRRSPRLRASHHNLRHSNLTGTPRRSPRGKTTREEESAYPLMICRSPRLRVSHHNNLPDGWGLTAETSDLDPGCGNPPIVRPLTCKRKKRTDNSCSALPAKRHCHTSPHEPRSPPILHTAREPRKQRRPPQTVRPTSYVVHPSFHDDYNSFSHLDVNLETANNLSTSHSHTACNMKRKNRDTLSTSPEHSKKRHRRIVYSSSDSETWQQPLPCKSPSRPKEKRARHNSLLLPSIYDNPIILPCELTNTRENSASIRYSSVNVQGWRSAVPPADAFSSPPRQSSPQPQSNDGDIRVSNGLTNRNGNFNSQVLQHLTRIAEGVDGLKFLNLSSHDNVGISSSQTQPNRREYSLLAQVRKHVKTLFGKCLNARRLPPPATEHQKKQWKQGAIMDEFSDDEDMASSSNPESDEHADPSFPYGDDGPGNTEASAETLAIMWRAMRRAGVHSFRPDFTRAVRDPENLFLWNLSHSIFIKLVKAGEYPEIDLETCSEQKIYEMTLSHAKTLKRQFREAGWGTGRLNQRAVVKRRQARAKHLRDLRTRFLMTQPGLTGLIPIVNNCTSDAETDNELEDSSPQSGDQEEDSPGKQLTIHKMPWRHPRVTKIFDMIDQLIDLKRKSGSKAYGKYVVNKRSRPQRPKVSAKPCPPGLPAHCIDGEWMKSQSVSAVNTLNIQAGPSLRPMREILQSLL